MAYHWSAVIISREETLETLTNFIYFHYVCAFVAMDFNVL